LLDETGSTQKKALSTFFYGEDSEGSDCGTMRVRKESFRSVSNMDTMREFSSDTMKEFPSVRDTGTMREFCSDTMREFSSDTMREFPSVNSDTMRVRDTGTMRDFSSDTMREFSSDTMREFSTVREFPSIGLQDQIHAIYRRVSIRILSRL
jgi:hypothetical protein